MIKHLIFTDLDGTLLNEEHSISTQNKELIDRLLQQESYVIPNTGRSFTAMKNAIKDHSFPYYICFNGCIITDSQGVHLINYPLATDLTTQIIEFCNTHQYSLVVYQNESLFYNKLTPCVTNYMNHVKLTGKPISDITYKGDDCFKMLLIMPADKMAAAATHFRSHFSNEPINTDLSADIRMEIYSIKSNKGLAIKWLTEYLKCSEKQTIAIGDAANDIEMIKTAHIGIAMGNASDDVKKHASYVSKLTNCDAQNGWYHAICDVTKTV